MSDPRRSAGPVAIRLAHPADGDAWREAARTLLVDAIPPERVVWTTPATETAAAGDLFADPAPSADAGDDAGGVAAHGAPAAGAPAFRVPRAFPELVADVVCHRDERRLALLYRTLWRLVHGEPRLLDDPLDGDVHALRRMAKAVRRDRHKMTAFVRFRRLPEVAHGDGTAGAADAAGAPERYAAWFEPEHRIVRSTADFFRRRFASMAFAIFTPEESVHWDTRELAFGPGATARAVPDAEAMEALWREYYANIFNPARLKLRAMRAEMPVKYWKNLPEASLIGPLSREASRRAARMVEAPATEAPGFARRAGLVRGAPGPGAGPAAGAGAADVDADGGGDDGGGPETGARPHSRAPDDP